MHLVPRWGPAIIATATTLAAGSLLVPAIPTASAVKPAGPVSTQSLLGGLLGLLDNVLTMTTEELQAALAGLTPTEIGDLLAAADPPSSAPSWAPSPPPSSPTPWLRWTPLS